MADMYYSLSNIMQFVKSCVANYDTLLKTLFASSQLASALHICPSFTTVTGSSTEEAILPL